MQDRASRMLIVEDDYFLANDLAKGLKSAGLAIEGPVPSLSKALACLQHEAINGAVLDIKLDREKAYEVADALVGRAIPIVFVTGYKRSAIPDRYRDVPLCLKPVETRRSPKP